MVRITKSERHSILLRRSFLFFIAFGLISFGISATPVRAAIVVDATSSAIWTYPNSTVTWTHTVTSTANTALLVFAECVQGLSSSTASYDGVPMTQIYDAENGATINTVTSAFILLNPTPGSHTVSTTWTNGNCNTVYGWGQAVSLTGVNDTSISSLVRSTSTATISSFPGIVSSTFSNSQNGDYLLSNFTNYYFGTPDPTIPTSTNITPLIISSSTQSTNNYGRLAGGFANGANANIGWYNGSS